jgi:hypothetical protein
MQVTRLFTSLLFVSLLAACGGGGSGNGGPSGGPNTKASTPPQAPAAKLTTLVGNPDSTGLHWILVGDGFTAAQQEDLRQIALTFVQKLTDIPELAAHTSVWNVHVLQAASAESGVDEPAAGRIVNTAFDGELGCGSNSRVACVSWEKVHAALLAVDAPRAELTVILNTPVYVGSSNSSGIVISRNAHAPLVVMHELGHRVAGLADEYVDSVVAGELMPYYVEGRYPNVTREIDSGRVPWRHWLANPGSGVGLFEGAYYASQGFFRPKQDSFMRTLEAPVGEVNAEAWIRAQYRVLPPASGATPVPGPVRGLAGDTLEFVVVSDWPRQAVSLSWFLDGVEIADARDATRLSWSADGGTHEVVAVAQDSGGLVLAPGATETLRRFTWQVTPNATPGAQKAAASPRPVAWLEVRVDANGHTVLREELARAVPNAEVAAPLEGEWRYSLLDEAGGVITRGLVADPRIVRTALSPPGERPAGHGQALLDAGVYYIGIPPGPAPRKLRLESTVSGLEKLAWTGLLPAAPIEIELAPR